MRGEEHAGGCLHDRLLTVGVFYSQQKQAIDDTSASLRSDAASEETRDGNGVVHQKRPNFKYFIKNWIQLKVSVSV